MARPCKEINVELLEELARIGCTDEEMARILKCSPDTLTRRFADSIKTARSEMKMSLRRIQIRLAENGNVAMAIWLGKQYLEQREPLTRIEIATEDADKAINEALKKYNLPESFAGEVLIESEM